MATPASFAPPPPAVAGWYPDPAGSPSMRYWDGTRWTQALSSAVPPASPTILREDSRGWALAAHLSALLALFVGLAFLGPLLVYLVRKDDPYVRRHAAQALNFNLSCLLYAAVLGFTTLFALDLIGAIFLIAVWLVLGIAWLTCIFLAATSAGQGGEYRYPLTIRFVS